MALSYFLTKQSSESQMKGLIENSETVFDNMSAVEMFGMSQAQVKLTSVISQTSGCKVKQMLNYTCVSLPKNTVYKNHTNSTKFLVFISVPPHRV